jgi:plasmid stabilization system protein ParE
MQLRWSPAAAEDLFRIVEYIRQENAPAAQRIAKTVYESAGSLKSFPNKGRKGRVEGRVNFLCRRFLSWWFIESARTLWKSQTSSTARRNGRQRIEREMREVAPRLRSRQASGF